LYAFFNKNYLNKLINSKEIVEIKKESCEVQFQHSSFDELNISNNNYDVNKSKEIYQKYSCVIEVMEQIVEVELICLHE